MKSSARLGLALVTFGSFLAFTACGDDDEPSPGGAGEGHGGGGHAEAPAICRVVGTLCHDADTGSGMGHDCHQLGHVGNIETCEEEFAGCIGFCVGGETGAGGAQ
jgi:hypothetical protein